MKPHALLIDFDRTLVDVQTHTDYAAAVAEIRREFGQIDSVDVPETDWGSVTQEAMAWLVALADRPRDWQRASDILEREELAVLDRAEPMPGLAEFLEMTRAVPRAIVTLVGPAVAGAAAERFGIGIADRMTRMAGQAVKPAPDQMLAACRALGVLPAVSAMIGDSSWDEAAAAAAGVRFLGVTNGGDSVFSSDCETATDLVGAARRLGF